MASPETVGEKFLALTNQIREKGEPVRALELATYAAVYLIEEGNVARAAEAFAAKSLAYRHLYQGTGERAFLIIARQSVTTAVELAKLSGDKKALAIPYFNLAKVHEDLGETEKAVEAYRLALENITNNPPPSHNRPGVVADFKVHLATAEYAAGDKSALERAEQAIEELKNSGERKISRYNEDVWVSGGYMALARVVHPDDPQGAREYLKKAKEAIDSNPELTTRQTQWQKLAEELE